MVYSIFADNIQSLTTFDGFIVYGADAQNTTNGIYLNNCGDSLTISNNTISSGKSYYYGSSYGIHVKSSNPSIINNNIIADIAHDGSGYGIYCENSSPEITGNTITAEMGTNCYGIYISNSIFLSNISENIVIALGGDRTSLNVGISCNSSSIPRITNNIIICGESYSSILGIENYNNPLSIDISNNIIATGLSTCSGTCTADSFCLYGLINATVSSNILFSVASSGYRYGLGEDASPYDPYEVINNIVFGTPNALYWNGNDSTYLTNICEALDTPGTSGTFGESDCNPILDTPVGTGNMTAAGTGDIFDTGFDPSDPQTYIIKPYGPADLDNSGGWTEGDIGTNPAHCGVN